MSNPVCGDEMNKNIEFVDIECLGCGWRATIPYATWFNFTSNICPRCMRPYMNEVDYILYPTMDK